MYGQKKSFTLVEAILTIVIMGILAGVILPHFVKEGFLGDLTLRSTVSQIASDIRYARQLAITNAAQYSIKFNFGLKEYRIYKGGAQVGESKKIPAEVSCSGTNQFDFYALGNCVLLPTNEGLLLSLNNSRYKITADPPTGAVVVEKIS